MASRSLADDELFRAYTVAERDGLLVRTKGPDWFSAPQGWLFKLNPRHTTKVRKTLLAKGLKKNRWFALRNNKLRYYVKENGSEKGTIEVTAIEKISSSELAGDEKSFEIVTSGRVFTLIARDRLDKLCWVKVLCDAKSSVRAFSSTESIGLTAHPLPLPRPLPTVHTHSSHVCDAPLGRPPLRAAPRRRSRRSARRLRTRSRPWRWRV